MNYKKSNSIIKFYFTGSRCVSNISWALSIIFGGFGFFLEGVASFFEINFLSFFVGGSTAQEDGNRIVLF